MKNVHVIIMAAGKGTRMKSSKPKVLHKLAGRPLIEHVVTSCQALKPAGITIIHGHGGELLQEWASSKNFSDIHWVLQEKQLGTAHAVLGALPHIDELGVDPKTPVLLLAGDVPLMRVETLKSFITNTDSDFGLMTLELENPFGYGRILRDSEDKVVGIVEEKDASPKEKEITEVNTNIMLASFACLKQYLPLIKNDNARKESLCALSGTDYCPL